MNPSPTEASSGPAAHNGLPARNCRTCAGWRPERRIWHGEVSLKSDGRAIQLFRLAYVDIERRIGEKEDQIHRHKAISISTKVCGIRPPSASCARRDAILCEMSHAVTITFADGERRRVARNDHPVRPMPLFPFREYRPAPEPIKDWSLAFLLSIALERVQMPVKIARSAPRPSFGLPELLVAIHSSRQMFQEILRLIAELRPQPPPAPGLIVGQSDQDRREGGEPRPLHHLPDGRGRHRTRQSCCKAGKARIFTPVRESSGESRLNPSSPSSIPPPKRPQ
jgi:hypothetical protein